MKKIFKTIFSASAILLILSSCEAKKVVVNREVDTTNDGKMLLGTQTKSQLLKAPYSDWYVKEHDEYAIDQKALSELRKKKIGSYSITLVMGTWCDDSHREVPRLMKILEELKYPEKRMTIIAVNRKKESPSGTEGIYNIQKVPTIIVQKYGKEIGRIIESPKSGWLERDLLEILNKDTSSIKDILK
ncbi:TlpA family protein disulfide reductase [Chryseobacterium koreense]|uniref:Thioredoxin n=1 Tax=Chryseobacterium koreense CCUG 49689 TaxID=1304281 RepID=A0A0J7J3V9_9FLAO|nr:thioredoxin family protein [Chryseobacterium koreense]KMQ72694.1 thioredoxin [Chryseobacterium koreense CCUG 49689]MBB5333097.1 thiol-disulfide isomerase/thioredoxin [Chryseobacterium koreense]